MVLRILASTLLLFTILFMPFWVSFILALGAMMYFSFFIEAIPILLLSDLLYGVKEVKLFNITFIAFIIAIVFLLIVEISKKKLRFKSKFS
jgi:hypothetical protein